MANPKIKSNPTRDLEQKQKEDYAAQSFPHEDAPLSRKALQLLEQEAKKEKELEKDEPKNFNINFIEDEVYSRELAYLGFKPQGESVIVLGPKVNIAKSIKDNGLQIDENTKRALLAKELAKQKAGYRVLAISPSVLAQLMEQLAKLFEKEYLNALSQEQYDQLVTQLFYTSGTYVFSKGIVIREINFFSPESEDLSYYEVYHREITSFMTQEQALRFKPVEQVVINEDPLPLPTETVKEDEAQG